MKKIRKTGIYLLTGVLLLAFAPLTVLADTASDQVRLAAGSYTTLGDVNGDYQVDAKDLTTLAKHVANIVTIKNSDLYAAADVNSDGSVDAKDLTHLAKYVANIIPDLTTDVKKELENDPEFLKFATNYAWTSLHQLNGQVNSNQYVAGTEEAVLEVMCFFPDRTGFSAYYPEGWVVSKNSGMFPDPMTNGTISEAALHEYAQRYFNISDEAFGSFKQNQISRGLYTDGYFAYQPAGWGQVSVDFCGIQAAHKDGGFYVVDFYGLQGGPLMPHFEWGTSISEIPSEYRMIYHAVFEKKQNGGTVNWCLHSLIPEKAY